MTELQSRQTKIPTRAIITSAAKVKLLSRLKNFWSMKSIMIQAKAKPELLNDPVFQEQAIQYFEKNTQIKTQKFWTQLSHETQMKATQYFILQEITETKNTRIVPSKDSAALYIILSGAAEVKEGTDGPEMNYVAGDMFGATELFAAAVGDPDNFQAIIEAYEKEQKVINATMEKGSYIRINLADFHRFVMGVNDDSEAAEQRAVEEDAKISGLAAEDLTNEDRFLVSVYRRARRLLDPDLFAFLDAYKLIPKHSREKNARFYSEGIHNKPLPPSTDNDTLELIIVLQGSIRVDIEALNKKAKHAIGVDRTGFSTTADKNSKQKKVKSNDGINDRHEQRRQQIALEAALEQRKKEEMVVLTGTLPLLRQGEGSLLFVTPAAKVVGMKDEDYDDDKHHTDDEAGAKVKQKRPDEALSTLLMLKPKSHHQQQQQAAALAQRTNNSRNIMNMLSTESSVDDLSLHSANSLTMTLKQLSGSLSPSSSLKRKNRKLLLSPAAKSQSSSVKKPTITASPLYKINLICEGPTAFLRIPFRYIQRILNEDSISRGLILRPMANAIQSQLVRAGERVVTRIKGLLPWIGAPPPELLVTEEKNLTIQSENGDLDLIDAEARERKRQAMDGVLHLPPPHVPRRAMIKEEDPTKIITPDLAAMELSTPLMGTYGQNILPRRGRAALNKSNNKMMRNQSSSFKFTQYNSSNLQQSGDEDESDNATSTLTISTAFTAMNHNSKTFNNPNVNPKKTRRRSSMINIDEVQRQAFVNVVKEKMRSKQLAPITLRSSIILKTRKNSLTDSSKVPLLSSIASSLQPQPSMKGAGLRQPSFQLPDPILEEAADTFEDHIHNNKTTAVVAATAVPSLASRSSGRGGGGGGIGSSNASSMGLRSSFQMMQPLLED